MDRDGVTMPEPLAYFLTWPTYGTWLPGDERGWVKRHRGYQPPIHALELRSMAHMTEDACRLDERERNTVEATIAEHCRLRGWHLYAVNCRSNHVHVVVTAPQHSDEVRKQLKFWTGRRLKALQRERQPGLAERKHWWAERGSQRHINDDASLEAAIVYVRDCQD